MPARNRAKRARDITELDAVSLRCTVYRRHNFPLPVWIESYTDEGLAALRADLRCDCGTRKVMYAHPVTFEVWPGLTWYSWPDGYLLEGGVPSQAEAFAETRRRQTSAQVRAARKAWLQAG